MSEVLIEFVIGAFWMWAEARNEGVDVSFSEVLLFSHALKQTTGSALEGVVVDITLSIAGIEAASECQGGL